jgi:proteasome lid subunit RPN8/RPN11
VKRFHLAPDLREQIQREARAALPRECCGLIEGVRSGDLVCATVLHPTRNIAGETDRFEIDPVDHFSILRAARIKNTEIVGCYHSHPNGSTMPSGWDLENVGEDGFIWLIVALPERLDGEFAAFVVKQGQLVSMQCEMR